jgi:hypothetical protein
MGIVGLLRQKVVGIHCRGGLQETGWRGLQRLKGSTRRGTSKSLVLDKGKWDDSGHHLGKTREQEEIDCQTGTIVITNKRGIVKDNKRFNALSPLQVMTIVQIVRACQNVVLERHKINLKGARHWE